MKIVGVSGSLNPDSVSRRLVEQVLSTAKTQGAQTELIDLRQYKLPFCDGRDVSQYGRPYKTSLKTLQAKMSSADAFVIGTPEYHGGYSGVLKNFLDLNSIDVFRGKLVALVGAAGGRLGAEAALNQLRIVFKNLEAICYPTQVTVGGGDLDSNKNINNQKTQARLNQMAADFVKLAQTFSAANNGTGQKVA